MTDDRLIEEAAKAIYETGVSSNFEDAAEWEREIALEEARAALAVFEKAHAPTDDEREALLSALDRLLGLCYCRFISGSIDLIQRRDGCTLAEAEETAIGEWERWMEWHNARVRRGVVAEEPEGEVEYRVFDSDGELWAGANSLQEARRYLSQDPTGRARIERAVWVPVKQEGAGQ